MIPVHIRIKFSSFKMNCLCDSAFICKGGQKQRKSRNIRIRQKQASLYKRFIGCDHVSSPPKV